MPSVFMPVISMALKISVFWDVLARRKILQGRRPESVPYIPSEPHTSQSRVYATSVSQNTSYGKKYRVSVPLGYTPEKKKNVPPLYSRN
jgi:hypothetical protein